jgi:hypothetical protein
MFCLPAFPFFSRETQILSDDRFSLFSRGGDGDDGKYSNKKNKAQRKMTIGDLFFFLQWLLIYFE